MNDYGPWLHLIDHPLVQHKLTLMRKKEASTNSFRRLLTELSMLMCYEVTRDMPTQPVQMTAANTTEPRRRLRLSWPSRRSANSP